MTSLFPPFQDPTAISENGRIATRTHEPVGASGSAGTDLAADPRDPGFPRKAPGIRSVQPPLGHKREHTGSRMGRRRSNARAVRQGNERRWPVLHQPRAQRLEGKVSCSVFPTHVAFSIGFFFFFFVSDASTVPVVSLQG